MDSSQNIYSSSINSKKSIDTSTQNSKKVNQELQIIVGFLDPTSINGLVFNEKTLKEMRGIIERISKTKAAAKQLYNEMNNPQCALKNNEEKNYKKLLEKTYESGLDDVKKYVEKIVEVFQKTADDIMSQMCKSTNYIEENHFRKNISPNIIIDKMNFVNKMTDLLNVKLSKDPDVSEVSYTRPLFEQACGDKCIPEEVSECSEDHETILLTAIAEEMRPHKIDVALNSTKSNKDFLMSHINQHKTLSEMLTKLERKMDKVNKDVTKKGGPPAFVNGELNTSDDIDYKKIKMYHVPPIDTKEEMEDYKVLTQRTQIFKRIRDSIMSHMKDLQQISTFCKEKLPKIVPVTFVRNEHITERSMDTYIHLFRFAKFMSVYMILKAMVEELTSPINDIYEQPNDFYFSKPHPRMTYSTRTKFIKDIFHSHFGTYIPEEFYGIDSVLSESYSNGELKNLADKLEELKNIPNPIPGKINELVLSYKQILSKFNEIDNTIKATEEKTKQSGFLGLTSREVIKHSDKAKESIKKQISGVKPNIEYINKQVKALIDKEEYKTVKDSLNEIMRLFDQEFTSYDTKELKFGEGGASFGFF